MVWKKKDKKKKKFVAPSTFFRKRGIRERIEDLLDLEAVPLSDHPKNYRLEISSPNSERIFCCCSASSTVLPFAAIPSPPPFILTSTHKKTGALPCAFSCNNRIIFFMSILTCPPPPPPSYSSYTIRTRGKKVAPPSTRAGFLPPGWLTSFNSPTSLCSYWFSPPPPHHARRKNSLQVNSFQNKGTQNVNLLIRIVTNFER